MASNTPSPQPVTLQALMTSNQLSDGNGRQIGSHGTVSSAPSDAGAVCGSVYGLEEECDQPVHSSIAIVDYTASSTSDVTQSAFYDLVSESTLVDSLVVLAETLAAVGTHFESTDTSDDNDDPGEADRPEHEMTNVEDVEGMLFKCLVSKCREEYPSRHYFIQHVKSHCRKFYRWTCPLCCSEGTSHSVPTTCSISAEHALSETDFRIEKRKCFPCGACGSLFISPEDFEIHIVEAHEGFIRQYDATWYTNLVLAALSGPGSRAISPEADRSDIETRVRRLLHGRKPDVVVDLLDRFVYKLEHFEGNEDAKEIRALFSQLLPSPRRLRSHQRAS